jgi:hypothetical protein
MLHSYTLNNLKNLQWTPNNRCNRCCRNPLQRIFGQCRSMSGLGWLPSSDSPTQPSFHLSKSFRCHSHPILWKSFERFQFIFMESALRNTLAKFFLNLVNDKSYSFIVTNFLRPLNTPSEKFTSEIVFEIYFFVHGWSYAFNAVYLFWGSLISSFEIKSLD